jgi:hypothetical protein
VDHDDTDTERAEHGKMHLSWEDTKNMWNTTYNSSIGNALGPDADVKGNGSGLAAIDIQGVGFRGKPPKWWYVPSEEIFKVRDGFLTPEEIAEATGLALDKLSFRFATISLCVLAYTFIVWLVLPHVHRTFAEPQP